MKTVFPIFKKVLKWLGITIFSLFLLLVVVLLLLRTPWAQQKIVNQASRYVSDKTGTQVQLDKLYITFRGNVAMEGLYLQGLQRDTLLYSKSLETGLKIGPLLDGDIAITRVNWEGLSAHVVRGKDSTFNFQFLIDSLAGKDPATADPAQATANTGNGQSGRGKFSIGPVSLQGFQVHYIDSISGMNARLDLGTLEVTNEQLNLDSSVFQLDEIHLAHTTARVRQFAPAGSNVADSTASALPKFSWNQVLIEDLTLVYNNKPQQIDSKSYVGTLALGAARLYLEEKHIALNKLLLKNSDIALQWPAVDEGDAPRQASSDSALEFSWPEWQLALSNVNFQNNNFSIHQGAPPAQTPTTFSPEHLEVNNFTLRAPELSLERGKAALRLDKLAFSEGMRPAFRLMNFAVDLEIGEQNAHINNLRLSTEKTQVGGNLQLNYPSLSALIENPQKALHFSLDLSQADFDISDAYYFNDSLRFQSFAKTLEKAQPQLTTQMSGYLNDLNISRLEINAFSQSSIHVSGNVQGLPRVENLQVAIPNLELKTTQADLSHLMDTASNFNPPAFVQVNASLNGNAQKLESQLKVNSPKGALALSAEAKNIASQQPSYKGLLEIKQAALGNMLKNSDLGSLSCHANFDGSGLKPQQLQLKTDIEFDKLEYRSYDYSQLQANLQANQGAYTLELQHDDKNLAMQLLAQAQLDSTNNHFDMRLNLRGADLTDLNLAQHPRKISMVMEASYDGQPQDFVAQLSLDDIIMIGADGNTYRSDTAFVGLQSKSDSSALLVNSSTLKGELQSNTSLAATFKTMETFIRSTWNGDTTALDSANRNINMQAYFRLENTPLLNDVLLPDLQRLDSVSMSLAFKPKADLLRLNVRVPNLLYKQVELEKLALDLNATADTLGLNLAYNHLRTGPINMYQTSLQATAGNGPGTGFFRVRNEQGKEIMYLGANVDRDERGQRYLHLQNQKLILNGRTWSTPENNRLTFTEKGPDFQNFSIRRSNKSLSLESGTERSRVNVLFNNFKLQALLSIFNAKEPLLGGLVNGNLKLLEVNDNSAFTADVQIDSLSSMNHLLGRLELNAENTSATDYRGRLNIKGPELGLTVQGDFSTAGESPSLDAKLALERLELALIQKFSPENIQQASGYLKGDIDFNGPTQDLKYAGELIFKEMSFKPTYLGTAFALNNEKVRVSNQRIGFERFTIKDQAGETLTIDGEIGTASWANPTFDLGISAQSFTAMDVSREKGKTLSGKAAFNLNADVTGDLFLPKVKARFELLKPSDVYYSLTPSQASIDSREGLVRFVNVKDTMEVLNSEEDQDEQLITGYDIDARILARPETRITIFPDPRSNDLITVQGEANLNFQLFPNGNTEMVGDYELSDGAYKLSLYELIKKRFDIQKGSRIVWSGQPTGAALDITALYETKAAPVDLMSDQLAGADQTTINRYKQKLPFQVQLFIDGTINQPQISFGLEMPEESRAAVGGSVYSRVQQLNNNENELNKQVFSLIAFNRFLPRGVGGGNDGGTTEGIARSSVSRLLSSQLNRLSDQYIEGVELNFDLDSYKDYQSGQAQQRTDLNISLRKSFLDNRLVIEVGSQVGVEGESSGRSQVLSDVKVEYLLTEDGRYRLEAFQENEYEGIIEGQVRITGLGILFSREFNHWQDLMTKNKTETPDLKAREEDEEPKPKDPQQSEK